MNKLKIHVPCFIKFNLCNLRPAYEDIKNMERPTQEYKALSF